MLFSQDLRPQDLPTPLGAVQVSSLKANASAPMLRQERKERARLLSQAANLHDAFLRHPSHAIVASEHTVFALAHSGYSFEEIVVVVECCRPVELLVSGSPVPKRYMMTLVLGGEISDHRPLTLICRLGDPPSSAQSWNLRITAAYEPSLAQDGWSGVCAHFPLCVCQPQPSTRFTGGMPPETDALAYAWSLLPAGMNSGRRVVEHARRLVATNASRISREQSQPGGYAHAIFPSPARCEWDLAIQAAVAARDPLPFSIGKGRDPIEIFGMPALRCSTCGEHTFDVALLAATEGLLRKWACQECRPTYYFRELATSLCWVKPQATSGSSV